MPADKDRTSVAARAELRQQVEQQERQLAALTAERDWMLAAARGESVSDFAESFASVRAIVDLRERADRAEARLAAVEVRERLLDGMAGPWCREELDGWSIVGMNHYSVAGVRHLFVSMARAGRCIKAESAFEPEVWTELAQLAAEAAAIERAARGEEESNG